MGRYAMRQNTLKTEGDRIGTAMIAFLFFSTARLWMERSAAGFAVTPAGDAVRFALTAASLAVPVLLLRNVPYTREKGISWSALIRIRSGHRYSAWQQVWWWIPEGHCRMQRS